MNQKQTRTLGLFVAIALAGAAIIDQMRLPADQRTWQGTLWGIVPYDFRFPTFERIQSTLWNKDNSQLLVPKVCGMGWDINFYPLFHPQEV